MKIKHLVALSATAVALLSLSGAAQAENHCSKETLKGAYGFTGHGQILGLLDSNNALHPFASPLTLDDVALIKFDGRGNYSRTDYGVINGLPKGGQTTFNPYQTGTYTVNSDCTGTMSVIYTAGGPVPAGTETDLQIVIAQDGTLIESVVSRAIGTGGSTPDGIMCPPNCQQGVQEQFEGKKVEVYGFR
ncbi:hypothetical protein A6V36_08960 [Paraburkholderia ginsengiterrae]|uniref:Uncharacterized protein n=1 Tax=Paraburkholderia ginsengiterrae TaxID=1462993 RepID=A0A1A9N8E7_9BURK|nr:hypothetical protein [Paraburkholderia ginsengiterrae]OAJ54951.1 hypothetical protein A6V36_08960 [Paraburkholderia ginsengiterrae]OAJ61135.1 hypothetical protein A6V37_03295 [Paraburkholderia ginsengiterrae]